MRGFIVEGPSDEKVIKQICKKLGIRPEVRLMRGNNLGKAGRLGDLLHIRGCEKVMLLKDSEHHEPSETRRRFEEAGLEDRAKLCIVVKAVESWLLADEKALEDYLKTEVNGVHNPEEVPDPAEFLEDIFRKAGKSYLKGGRDPEELARRLHLEKIREKCPSFRKFEVTVQN